MPRYAVILDTSWACNSYDEIVVEKELAMKYKGCPFCLARMKGGAEDA